MNYIRKFLNNKDGSIAVQFCIVIFPILAVVGVGIDYTRVAVVKTSLQSTLDHNILSMNPREFNNRAQMEQYIVALAGVNLESDTVEAKISIRKNAMRIYLRDTVKTPVMSLMGRPEVQILASIDVKYDAQSSNRTNSSNKLKSATETISRTKINKLKRNILARIDRVKASKYYTSARKRETIKRLRKKLQKLKKL